MQRMQHVYDETARVSTFCQDSKVGKSFYIRQFTLSLSPSFCALINHSISKVSPTHIAVSTPSPRVACRPIASGYILSFMAIIARVKRACMSPYPTARPHDDLRP
jgi:hypothetical protein